MWGTRVYITGKSYTDVSRIVFLTWNPKTNPLLHESQWQLLVCNFSLYLFLCIFFRKKVIFGYFPVDQKQQAVKNEQAVYRAAEMTPEQQVAETQIEIQNAMIMRMEVMDVDGTV